MTTPELEMTGNFGDSAQIKHIENLDESQSKLKKKFKLIKPP